MKKIFTLLVCILGLLLSQSVSSQLTYTPGGNELSTVAETKVPDGSLPVKIISFDGNIKNDKINLQWIIDENETVDRFEVEKSADGMNFSIAALVFTSEKTGNENYMFYEKFRKTGIAYYRLKIYSKSNDIHYSKVLKLQLKPTQK